VALSVVAQPIPLALDADGVYRVGGTRVTLDTVIAAFEGGSTPEEIAQDYSSLALADIYAVITYYLRERAAVDAYLKERQTKAGEVRQENLAKFDTQGLRQRLERRLQHTG